MNDIPPNYDYSELHPAIRVKASQVAGLGLFTTAAIAKGETIWRALGVARVVSVSELADWSEEERQAFLARAWKIDGERYEGESVSERSGDDAGFLMNHSCEPNTVFVSGSQMVAFRDIAPGEEITYDYATSEDESLYTLRCACGSRDCRGTIRGSDYMIPALQRKYRGHFMPHIQAKIDALLAKN